MSYGAEWIPAAAFFGALLLLIVPSFALIALMVLALAAVVALLALAGALVATPYLLVRHFRRRLAERRQSSSVPIARVIAQTGSVARRSGVQVVGE